MCRLASTESLQFVWSVPIPSSFSNVVRTDNYTRTVLSTDQKGAIAEAAIAATAAKLGVGVFRPLTVERYDLIFDLRPELVRVQCKWAARYEDVLVVRCRTCRRGRDGFIRSRYTADEVDAFAAYCLELDRCYFLPLDRFQGRSTIQLRLAPTKNNQQLAVNWAAEFEFEATLAVLLGP